MEQKHVLWPAVIIIILITAGAVYFAVNLAGLPSPRPTPTPTDKPPATFNTAELDQQAGQNDQLLAEIEAVQAELQAVDAAQDDLGI